MAQELRLLRTTQEQAELLRASVPKLIPDRAHRLVRILLRAMRKDRITYGMMEKRSGVSWYTLLAWRKGRRPDLQNIEACLNVMELEITTTNKANTSRQVAREDGAKTYTGAACGACGATLRYVANSRCIACTGKQRQKKLKSKSVLRDFREEYENE